MWHYESNGQPAGPISEDAVALLIRDGVILRTTLVWKQGMDHWLQADQTELGTKFTVPPPLLNSSYEETDGVKPSPEIDVIERETPSGPKGQPSHDDVLQESEFSNSEIESAPAVLSDNRRPYQVSGEFRPLWGIFGHSKVAVLFFLLGSAALIISDVAMINFIQSAIAGSFQSDFELEQQAAFVDNLALFSSVGFLFAFAWSAIIISRWIFRAMKNLREAGHETTVSPGWAVGWHFIPVALLWMPFRGTAQIWRGSLSGDPLGDTKLPASMRIWWTMWLLGNFTSFFAVRIQDMGYSTDDFSQVSVGLGIGILSTIAHIVSALLLLNIMKSVSASQHNQPENVL